MRIATAGRGTGRQLRALASQVKPRFMGPAVAASVYGGVLVGITDPVAGTLHGLATFLALYAAHVKDGLIDTYRRGEESTMPLTRGGCRLVIFVASMAFLAVTAGLLRSVGVVAALLVLPLWILGYLHAPWLDRRLIGTSADYAFAMGLGVLGGSYVQVGTVTGPVMGVAAAVLPAVAAGAVLEDVPDVEVDHRIGKRTVAAAYGEATARRVALALLAGAALVVAGLVWLSVLPRAGPLGAALLAVGAVGTRFPDPTRGVTLIIGLTAAALVVLLAALRGVPPW